MNPHGEKDRCGRHGASCPAESHPLAGSQTSITGAAVENSSARQPSRGSDGVATQVTFYPRHRTVVPLTWHGVKREPLFSVFQQPVPSSLSRLSIFRKQIHIISKNGKDLGCSCLQEKSFSLNYSLALGESFQIISAPATLLHNDAELKLCGCTMVFPEGSSSFARVLHFSCT